MLRQLHYTGEAPLPSGYFAYKNPRDTYLKFVLEFATSSAESSMEAVLREAQVGTIWNSMRTNFGAVYSN